MRLDPVVLKHMSSPAEVHGAWRAEQMITAPRIDNDKIISIKNSRLPLAFALPIILAACGTGSAANTEASRAPELLSTPRPDTEVVELTPSPPPSEISVSPNPVEIPEASPTFAPATPEATEKPALSVTQVADKIINQKDKTIKKTTIKDVKTGTESLWKKYGEQLSQIVWSDSPTGKLTKDYLMNRANLTVTGFPTSENQSNDVLAFERLVMSEGFIVTYLNAYDKIEETDIKVALATEADRIYDYIVTSIDPSNKAKCRAQLEKDIPGLLKLSNL